MGTGKIRALPAASLSTSPSNSVVTALHDPVCSEAVSEGGSTGVQPPAVELPR